MATVLPPPTVNDPRFVSALPAFYTPEEQAANAILWIENLLNYRKTIAHLGKDLNGDGKPDCFCVMGAALHTLGVNAIWDAVADYRAASLFGLNSSLGAFHYPGDLERPVLRFEMNVLAGINDRTFKRHKTFRAMRKFMIQNIDVIFTLPVAEILNDHYEFNNVSGMDDLP